MTSVGFVDAKCLLLPRSPSGAALVPSHAVLVSFITVLVSSSTALVSSSAVLVPSGAALVLLQPGMELSLVERDMWKEEHFLKQPLKGKFRSRDFIATGAALLFKIQPG